MNEVERGKEVADITMEAVDITINEVAGKITVDLEWWERIMTRQAALEKVAGAVAEYKRCPEPGRWHKVEAALSELDQEE